MLVPMTLKRFAILAAHARANTHKRMPLRRLILPVFLLLGACGAAPGLDTPTRAANPTLSALPPIKTFSISQPVPPSRANSDIARDFIDLTFNLESGRALPTFTRFETSISVRVTGAPPPTLIPDLDRLIRRLNTEAGIDISRRTGMAAANITIEAVSRAEIRKYLPSAACFVVPNISSLSQYRAAKRSGAASWGEMRTRERLAIFLPNDSSPQEIRDCLHEELAQALGPLNDLYRLPDSVYNDDNVHTVLTGFDMLILRAYYAPELRSGMTKAQVSQRIPAILSRLNPAGDHRSPRYDKPTPRSWITAIQTALGPGASYAQRVKAANRALSIATAEGWVDQRRAFSHFAIGRLVQSSNAKLAREHFLQADRFYKLTPNTALHQAYSATQLAAYAVHEGRGQEALRIIKPHLAIARRHENAALLANLMLLQAEALDLIGQRDAAQAVRLDSLGWARYGFGADWVVRAKLNEIAVISPLNNTNG